MGVDKGFNIDLKRPRYTSAMMYLRMLLWANVAYHDTVCREVLMLKPPAQTSIKSYREEPELFTEVSVRRMTDIMLTAMEKEGVLEDFKNDLGAVLGPFAKYIDLNCRFILEPKLKLCPECMEKARHYIFHQIAFLDECPVCGTALQTKCPVCGEETSRLPFMQKSGKEFLCSKCGENLTSFKWPEEMFASYWDDAGIDYILPDYSEDIMILSTDPADDAPHQHDWLNAILKDFYLNGKRPEADISLVKSKLKIVDDVDIVYSVYKYIDDLIGTDISEQYRFSDGRNYNDMHEKVRGACAKMERYETIALMKLFEKARQNSKEMHRLKGFYLSRAFRGIVKTVERAELKDGYVQGILNAIADDWIKRVHECMTEELEIRSRDSELDMSALELKTPHFFYVIFESRSRFDIVVIPSEKSYEMFGQAVKYPRKSNKSSGCVKIHRRDPRHRNGFHNNILYR